MIPPHSLGHADEPFLLNDDLIVTVEACPDTHVALATGTKIFVTETPEAVADAGGKRGEVRCCESYCLNRNWRGRRLRPHERDDGGDSDPRLHQHPRDHAGLRRH